MIVLEVYSLEHPESEQVLYSDHFDRRVNLLVFSELAGATRWAEEHGGVTRTAWRQVSVSPRLPVPKWIARTATKRYVATEVELADTH